MFILDGSGMVCTAEGDFPLRPGTAILVPGGVLHQFRNTGAELLRFDLKDANGADIDSIETFVAEQTTPP